MSVTFYTRDDSHAGDGFRSSRFRCVFVAVAAVNLPRWSKEKMKLTENTKGYA